MTTSLQAGGHQALLGEAVGPRNPLLVVHLIGEPGEPAGPRAFPRARPPGRGRLGQEGYSHGPVQAPGKVARVLDDAEEAADSDLEVQFLPCHSLDGASQRLAEADGATRDVPESLARPGFPNSKQHAIVDAMTTSTVSLGTLAYIASYSS